MVRVQDNLLAETSVFLNCRDEFCTLTEIVKFPFLPFKSSYFLQQLYKVNLENYCKLPY